MYSLSLKGKPLIIFDHLAYLKITVLFGLKSFVNIVTWQYGIIHIIEILSNNATGPFIAQFMKICIKVI